MASTRQIWVDSQQVSCGVTYTDSTTGYTATLDTLLPLDWGEAPTTIYELPPGIGDGMYFMGSKAEPREFDLYIRAKMAAASQTYWEPFKDFLHGKILSWFKPAQRLVTIKVIRDTLTAAATTTTCERVLYVKPTSYKSWAIDNGALDQTHNTPVTLVKVPLHAPYPWWMDSTTSGKYLSATGTLTTSPASISVTNDGDMPAGVAVAFQCANTATAITWSLTYGATLITCAATITLSATDWVVFDFGNADPLKSYIVSGIATSDLQNATALAAGTNKRGSVTTWPTTQPLAQLGTVSLAANISAGSGTGSFKLLVRRRWADC